MKVSDLEGEALDRWVQNASLRDAQPNDRFPNRPSTDWADGGPIIEREKIDLWFEGDRWNANRHDHFGARDSYGAKWPDDQEGYTPLIAAMRCFVASRFGEEVPDE